MTDGWSRGAAEGVGVHVELCPDGSSESRCALDHRGIGRLGVVRAEARTRMRPSLSYSARFSPVGKEF